MGHRLNKRGTGETITWAEGERMKNAGEQEQAAIVYLKKDGAWHGLGKAVESAMNVEEAIKLAGLDWEVKLAPIFDADMREIPKEIGQRTYRSDNNVTLGVVGKRYTVIQTKRGFEILDDIVGKGNANFVTAGALGAGEQVFATVRLPQDIKIAGDIITPYFHTLLSHDGTGSNKVYAAPERQVCANTVNIALSDAMRSKRIFSVRHTRNYEQFLAEAARTLGVMREYAQDFEQVAHDLLKQSFDKVMFENLVKQLLPDPKDEDASKRTLTMVENQRTKLYSAYNASDLDNVRGTAWGVINAVADYSDHSRNLRGTEEAKKINGFLNTFTEQGSRIKDKALELVLARN